MYPLHYQHQQEAYQYEAAVTYERTEDVVGADLLHGGREKLDHSYHYQEQVGAPEMMVDAFFGFDGRPCVLIAADRAFGGLVDGGGVGAECGFYCLREAIHYRVGFIALVFE